MSVEVVANTAQDVLNGNLEKAIMTMLVIMGGSVALIYNNIVKHKAKTESLDVKIDTNVSNFRKDVNELKQELDESIDKLDQLKDDGNTVKEKVQALEIQQVSHIRETDREIERVNKQLDEVKSTMIDNHKEVISFISNQSKDINHKVDVINQSLQRILGGMDGNRDKM